MWGELIEEKEIENKKIVEDNPYKYKSYYYDKESGLYYLKSRYYSASLHRFISLDQTEYMEIGSITGLNLYAYCGNDPINHVDPDGCFALPNWAKWMIGGVVIVGLGIATIFTGGAAGGIIYGAAIATITLGTVGAASGAIGGMIYDAVNGNEFGTSIWTGTKIGFWIGAIAGAIIGVAVGDFASASVYGLTNTSFWTGLGPLGETIAGNAANSQGLITLGQTFGGKCASVMTKLFGYRTTKYLWISLSKTMASIVAMGSVTLFYGGTISATSIYMMYEYPELVKRGIEIIEQLIGGLIKWNYILQTKKK